MHLLPKVFRTEGDMADFEPSKIYDSIITETGMNEEDAKHVTEAVVRRIISSGIKFLSGPHIREIVCSILSEQHFEEERKLYTRIGMPLMDYEEILEKGPKSKSGQNINPEKIHHWAANQLAEEYTLLRILDDEESKAHLYGDIYIHKLKYFDLRPLSQTWDPRMILENGVPPIMNSNVCCKSGPAEDFIYATHHLANWLAMAQGEFSGTQALDFITIFLAPYVKNLNESEIKHGIKSFIYELSQLEAVIGRDTPITSISACPVILDVFSKSPAITSKGKVEGIYGDYNNECLKLFNAITEIFLKGDYYGNSFLFPKHVIYMTKDWIDRYKSDYLSISQEIVLRQSPFIINLCSDWQKNEIKKNYLSDSYYNFGTLQNISLNLPRYAYLSKNEDNFFEILPQIMYLCLKIFEKKKLIIQKRLSSKHLPLCGSKINENNHLFKIEHQNFAFNIVGLNECIKFLTNNDMHENQEAYEFGIKIIKRIKESCEKLTLKEGYKYVIQENLSNRAAYRFAKLDLKHFPKTAILSSVNDGKHYTNSTHFKMNIKMKLVEKLKKQSEFHKIIQNGHNFYNIFLDDVQNDPNTLYDLLLDCCQNSDIGCLRFSK